jgi:hypothetical protein
MPALRMGQCQPSGKSRQVIVFARPESHMPMVWHNTKCKYAHTESIPGIDKDSFESLVVGRRMKNLRTRSCAIEDVIDNTARCDPSWPSHGLPSLVRIMYGCVVFSEYYTTKKYLGVL